MSPLLPNMGPPVENTHEPINEAELQQLVEALQQEAQKQPDGRLPSKVIDEVAARLGKKRSHAWAALALDPNLVPEMKYDTLFAVCVGKCQLQGAIPALDKMLELRDLQVDSGKPAFEVLPRHCLDLCPHAPVAISRSQHGQAAHPRLKPEELPELIDMLCNS